MGYVHTMEYNTTMENKLLLHATIEILWNKRIYTQKSKYGMIPFTQISKTGKINLCCKRSRKQLPLGKGFD